MDKTNYIILYTTLFATIPYMENLSINILNALAENRHEV